VVETDGRVHARGEEAGAGISLSDYTLGFGQGWCVDELLREHPEVAGMRLRMDNDGKVTVETVPWLPDWGYWPTRDMRVGQRIEFGAGLYYVQDAGSLLPVSLLDPRPGELVCDLCAAPGGKTTYIAQKMEDRGRVVALDLNPQRLQLMRANCARLGVTCVEPSFMPERLPQDGGKPVRSRLLDAPCSNTGVMRHRIDVKWRLRETDIAQHAVQVVHVFVYEADRGMNWANHGGVIAPGEMLSRMDGKRQVLSSFGRWRLCWSLAG
jgi:hypothetical protein